MVTRSQLAQQVVDSRKSKQSGHGGNVAVQTSSTKGKPGHRGLFVHNLFAIGVLEDAVTLRVTPTVLGIQDVLEYNGISRKPDLDDVSRSRTSDIDGLNLDILQHKVRWRKADHFNELWGTIDYILATDHRCLPVQEAARILVRTIWWKMVAIDDLNSNQFLKAQTTLILQRHHSRLEKLLSRYHNFGSPEAAIDLTLNVQLREKLRECYLKPELVSPLHFAILCQDQYVVERLLSAGSSYPAISRCPQVHCAIIDGSFRILSTIVTNMSSSDCQMQVVVNGPFDMNIFDFVDRCWPPTIWLFRERDHERNRVQQLLSEADINAKIKCIDSKLFYEGLAKLTPAKLPTNMRFSWLEHMQTLEKSRIKLGDGLFADIIRPLTRTL
jgi:hypothetical protein